MARSPAAPPLLEGEELMDIPVEKRARKSMVVVRDANGEYCSGCVLKSKGKYTYVLTQSSFASGREDTLKICFFDQIEREASAFASGDTFCLLGRKGTQTADQSRRCVVRLCPNLLSFLPLLQQPLHTTSQALSYQNQPLHSTFDATISMVLSATSWERATMPRRVSMGIAD
ncbi:Os03g0846900 [Oryza sativa Japonica Group]|uniref:Expressed protein n=1 Tax=Oryza sativa subsp. japonica TaxID=39947 RepID=Q10AN1_ORYSJ|nr:expressed protein [Oryza sativa Japonica Group]BAS87347.1 Os03g0846900 [Oryza sativa Japonica Group]